MASIDDKKTIAVLTNMLKTHDLSAEEKEAIHAAIGVLSWTKLAQGRIKNIKEKRERDLRRSR